MSGGRTVALKKAMKLLDRTSGWLRGTPVSMTVPGISTKCRSKKLRKSERAEAQSGAEVKQGGNRATCSACNSKRPCPLMPLCLFLAL